MTDWESKFKGEPEKDIPPGYHTFPGPASKEIQDWASTILNDSGTTYGQVFDREFNGTKYYARVEHHTWTYRNGKLITGHFKGVTVYEPMGTHPDITSGASGKPTEHPSSGIIGLTKDFFPALIKTTLKYHINPLDLLAVMAFESGIKPSAMNKQSKAVGLIQFMPSTLKNMGYKGDVFSFQKLSAVEQMPYVDRYFAPYASKYKLDSAGRVYQAVFLPASLEYAHKPDEIVAGSNGPHAEAYHANKGFDVNHKGWITVQDLTNATIRAKKAQGNRWLAIEQAVKQASFGMSPVKKMAIGTGLAAAIATGTKLLGWW